MLELDLTHVGEIDTCGLQLLALAKRESHHLDHVLRIVGHSPAVREVIEFLNLVAFFGDPLTAARVLGGLVVLAGVILTRVALDRAARVPV